MSRHLPSKWAMTTFDLVGEYTDYVANGSFASLKENVTQTDVEDYAILVRLRDQTKKWKGPFRYVTKESFEFLSKSELKPGDLFLTNVGAPGKTFLVPDLGKPMTMGPNGIRVRASKATTNSYLNYYFSSPSAQDDLKSISAGNAQQKFNKTDLKKTELPLPPLNEQIRIVNKLDSLLDKVDAAQTRLEKIPTLLKRFRQSVLAAATSGELTRNWRLLSQVTPLEPFLEEIKKERETLKLDKKLKKSFGNQALDDKLFKDIPDSWVWVNFDAIAANHNHALKAGPFGSALRKKDCVAAGYKVYGQEQVIAGDENLVTYYVTEEKYQSLIACKIASGDILISLVGTIGKVLVLSEHTEPGIINPRLVKLTLQEQINRQFIKLFLDSPQAHDFFKSFSHGGTMEILNLEILRKLPICLPPVEEQKEIVRRVDSLFAFADSVEKQYVEAKKCTDHLTQSLLAKAFRGELVPQDPNDEPASELLKRIQAEREELKSASKTRQKKA